MCTYKAVLQTELFVFGIASCACGTIIIVMAAYKMIYVDARGRGEILRLLFAYKGVEFEDVRIPHTEIAEARKGQ